MTYNIIENFILVAGQTVTLFLIVGIGFFLCKAGRLARQTVTQVSYLQVNIIIPCVIFNSLRIERNMQVIREMGLAALGSAACYGATIFIASFMYRKKQRDTAAVLRFGAVYSNVAFMGFPLVEAVFGKEALVFAAVSLAVFTLFQWTHGVYIMGGRDQLSARAVLRSPGIVALAIGFISFMVGYDYFDSYAWPLGNAISFVANMNTPLALTVLGAQMAFSDYTKLFKSKVLYGACAVRLVAFPALAALIMLPLRSMPHVYFALATLCATPAAGLTSGFSERYSRDVPTAAQLVTLSTLLSAVTLPLFVAVLQAIVTVP
ncbi:MAG: AEC family transporter [Oscillospiraceae bacterium]|nr:AEC family transporter [Oscillospiraceae bacterium]